VGGTEKGLEQRSLMLEFSLTGQKKKKQKQNKTKQKKAFKSDRGKNHLKVRPHYSGDRGKS
jgi:hypothetical protein